MFHRTDFGGFLVCCYKAIQQLNGVEKSSVAISLILNHNLTELNSFTGPLVIGTFEKRAPGLKTSMGFRGQVWKRVWKMTIFGLK